jgi:hypothetical protein
MLERLLGKLFKGNQTEELEQQDYSAAVIPDWRTEALQNMWLWKNFPESESSKTRKEHIERMNVQFQSMVPSFVDRYHALLERTEPNTLHRDAVNKLVRIPLFCRSLEERPLELQSRKYGDALLGIVERWMDQNPEIVAAALEVQKPEHWRGNSLDRDAWGYGVCHQRGYRQLDKHISRHDDRVFNLVESYGKKSEDVRKVVLLQILSGVSDSHVSMDVGADILSAYEMVVDRDFSAEEYEAIGNTIKKICDARPSCYPSSEKERYDKEYNARVAEYMTFLHDRTV